MIVTAKLPRRKLAFGAAAAALLEHGVEKVYYLAICIGRGF